LLRQRDHRGARRPHVGGVARSRPGQHVPLRHPAPPGARGRSSAGASSMRSRRLIALSSALVLVTLALGPTAPPARAETVDASAKIDPALVALIRGHAELLLRRLSSGNPDPKASKSAGAMIVKHADRLAELLTTLFDVHCLEAGLLSISYWPTDLGALVRDVAEGLRPTARHTIRALTPEGVVGECDERRIRQVLMNLLSNAQKYSNDGSIVTVSVVAYDRTATISVSDQGIGIDTDDLMQVFRRGYRAES